MIFGDLGSGSSGILDNIKQLESYLSSVKQLYGKFNISLEGLSEKDVKSLQKYVDSVRSGSSEFEALQESMGDTSDAAKGLTSGFNSLIEAAKNGEITEEELAAATQDLAAMQQQATFTSKALATALRVIGNIAVAMVISTVIRKLSELHDKIKITTEDLAEMREEAVDSMSRLRDSADSFASEAESIAELIEKYKEIKLSTDDTTKVKDDLLQIQNDLIEKFGDEAKSLDLLNDKYDDAIAKIKTYSAEKYNEWKREHAADIAEAEEYQNYFLDLNSIKLAPFSTSGEFERTLKLIDKANGTMYSSLYLIEDVQESLQDFEVSGVGFFDGLIHNDILLSGSLQNARDQLQQLIDLATAKGFKKDQLAPLSTRLQEINKILNDTDTLLQTVRLNEAQAVDTIGTNTYETISYLKQLNAAVGDARSAWFDHFKELQEGFDNTIQPMEKALQSLANGDALSATDFWGLVALDKSNILTDIQMVGDKFVVNQEQLIALKDDYINQQIDSLKIENENLKSKQDDLRTTIKLAEAELSLLGARGMANEAYRREFKVAEESIRQAKANLADYGDQIKRNNVVIDSWNARLGNTVDLTEQLKKQITEIQNRADDLLKAQEYKIDQIINSHQSELDALNDEKEALEEELDVLNEQKDAIEEIISNYDAVNSIVQKTIEQEISALEDEKKSIEDTYKARIDALKAENEEREDAIDYAEKLKNLENAKNNKVRVYDEARGWHYASNSDDINKAQSELRSYENNQAIKQLEAERDALLEATEDLIESKQDYADNWKKISEKIQDDIDEELAAEILGADWREKIANGDEETLEKFAKEYTFHNSKLREITNTEIKLKKKAIEAKDAEIKSKQEQINKWKEYKTTVQNAAREIEEATKSYMELVPQVQLDEQSSLATRTTNLNNFKTAYTEAMQAAIDKQKELDGLNNKYSMEVEVTGTDKIQEAIDYVHSLGIEYSRTAIAAHMSAHAGDYTKEEAENILTAYADTSTNNVGATFAKYKSSLPLTAEMLQESAALTSEVGSDFIRYKSAPPSTSNLSNSTSNYEINIDKIVTDNPEDFANQLNSYFKTKLTESYTNI